MKRFMKGCAITALILLILGFVMALVAGTAEGAGRINEVVESVTDGKLHFSAGIEEGFSVLLDTHEWFDSEIHYDITDNMMFDDDYEILKGDVEKYAVGSGVKKLDVEAGGCAFYFKQSEDSNFYVEAKETGKFQCFIKNDTLYVKTTRTIKDWDNYDECRIILYIPADYRFEQVDVELGAGLLEMADVVADKMEMEVGAGQIITEYLEADKCDITVGMGEIIIEDMQVTKMDAEVGMGHLQMDGNILGDLNAECAMGSMELDVAGSEEDFNYTIEAAMGNVSIGGADYSGLAQDKTVNNSADKNMTLECAMGNIEVDFEN